MSTRLLYEDDLGRISKVPQGREGTFLVGGKRMDWKTIDAANIPYTSPESGPLANVSAALDQTLLMVKRLQLTISAVEETNARIDGQQNDVLASLRKEVADLNRFFQETSTKVVRASHSRVTVAITSNPALTVDGDRQTIAFDLSAKGSFDDSRSGLGVNSIQLALEAIAAKQKELTYTVSALQDGVTRLRKTVQSFEGE